jgi:hypothetical protein
MKLKRQFIKNGLSKRCAYILLHVPNSLYFTKKISFDPKNVNNCKQIVFIQLMLKLAVLMRFLGSEMIFFCKLKKIRNM